MPAGPAAPRARTAFVTGATGFVGTNLVEALVAAGWRVTALRRPGSPVEALRRLGVSLAPGDVTDAASIRDAVPDGTDVIFHVAASTTMWSRRHAEQDRVNVLGTRNVVDAARARDVPRLVHTSSVAAFGFHDGVVIGQTPSNALSSGINYFRTKWLAEQEVQRGLDAGLDAVVVNPANVIGPHDRANWSRLFVLVERGALPGLLPGRGSWCHAPEVARAHVAAAERGRTGERYLLGGADASFAEVVRTIGEITGHRVPTRVLRGPVLHLAAAFDAVRSWFTGREPAITPEGIALASATVVCSCAKAERELGYRPVPLREMLEDCWRWMVAAGLLAGRAR